MPRPPRPGVEQRPVIHVGLLPSLFTDRAEEVEVWPPPPISDRESERPCHHPLTPPPLSQRSLYATDAVFLRLAKLEAGFDQMRGFIHRFEELELRCAQQLQVHGSGGHVEEPKMMHDPPEVVAAQKIGRSRADHHDMVSQAVDFLSLPHEQKVYDEWDMSTVAQSKDSDNRDRSDKGRPISLPYSIYSDYVLTCARGRLCPIVSSTFLCLACFVAQLLFVGTIADFGVDEMSEQIPLSRKWGSSFLANISDSTGYHVDTLNNMTLGMYRWDEHCQMRAWSWEAVQVETLVKYIRPHWISGLFNVYAPNGLTLGFLSLLLWASSCVLELREAIEFMGLLSLPLPSDRAAYTFNDANNKGSLTSLSWGPRFAVFLVTVCRAVVVVRLGYYGCQYLVHTTCLVDYILKSVALNFILGIDDLCFRFLSPDKQRALTTLAPPVLLGKTACACRRLAPVAEVASALSVFIIAGVAWSHQLDFAKVIDQVGIGLCGMYYWHDLDQHALALGIDLN